MLLPGSKIRSKKATTLYTRRSVKVAKLSKFACKAFATCAVLFFFISSGILFSHLHEDFKINRLHHGEKAYHGTQIRTDDTSEVSLDKPITMSELKDARSSLAKAKEHTLTPLRAFDKENYTVRINTWHRNDQLIASVNHLLSCPAIAQIQIVWCDQDNDPPLEIYNLIQSEKQQVIVEYHLDNSLNERFNILSETPTLGILSIDDDVLRPCEAMDAGFFRWTDYPNRIVGFDARGHVINNQASASAIRKNDLDLNPTWNYGSLSTTRKNNKYSLTLPRFCFLHKDYLDMYMHHLPGRIMRTVSQNFNCEDIAMCFFVSALNHGQVPLLADGWAVATMVKLKSLTAISATSDHHKLRNECVDEFGFLLGLKDGYAGLTSSVDSDVWGVLRHQTMRHQKSLKVENGADSLNILEIRDDFVPRRVEMIKMLRSSRNKYKELKLTLEAKVSKFAATNL